jgi:hypothetical protein
MLTNTYEEYSSKKPQRNSTIYLLDIPENTLSQLEEYIWRWYPKLQSIAI